MTRPKRIEIENGIYHVMNRGLARETIAFGDEDFQTFERCLNEISKEYNVQIYAFCLMSNHYHILMRTLEANLSRAMRHFAHTFAQRLNKRLRRDGPVFRGRFKSIVVENESYLVQLVRYIHLNPVKAGLVNVPEQYSWSSASHYISDKPPAFLKIQEVLDYFGRPLVKAKIRYRDFLDLGNRSAIENFYNRKRLDPILNDENLLRASDKECKNYTLPGT